MRKPQHAWWKSIDNSYHPFVTCLTTKPHGVAPVPQEILDAQKRFESNPNQCKNFAMADHKIQEESVCLPNPYKPEIDNFDNEVDEQLESLYKSGALSIEP